MNDSTTRIGALVPGPARALLATTALLVCGAISPALAQHHHHGHSDHESKDSSAEPGAEDSPALQVHAGVHLESGQAEAFGADRDYQGLALMVGLRLAQFELMFHMPTYRIELGGAARKGLGDIHLMAGWIALERGPTEAGLTIGIMPPFGNDEVGIGMGHWMAMAGGFARTSRGRFRGELTLGYGGSLGGGGHAEHGILVWPSVAPMNGQEIRSTANLGVDLGHGFGASAALLGAVPIGTGAFIAMAGSELSYQLGRYTLGVGLRHGLASHTAAMVLSSSLMGMF